MKKSTISAVSVIGAIGAAVTPVAVVQASVPAATKTYSCTTNTDYGPVTVSVRVGSGKAKIARVIAPTDLPKSTAINARAVPILKARAVAKGLRSARVAKVSNVSGATSTSRGFKSSLRSCLAKARL